MWSNTRVLYALVISVFGAAPAKAETIIKVSLLDGTGDSGAGMAMTVEPDRIPAGPAKFEVVNRSKTLAHEMLIVVDDKALQSEPFDGKKDTLIEGRLHSKGEVSNLKPGRSGSLKVSLAPGTYRLICNHPGHFRAGMATSLMVTSAPAHAAQEGRSSTP